MPLTNDQYNHIMQEYAAARDAPGIEAAAPKAATVARVRISGRLLRRWIIDEAADAAMKNSRFTPCASS